MQFEIISTGDEVITGFITDTNVSYLAQELLSLGIQARFRHTVGDDLQDITTLLSQRSQEADVILVNGGLGPTSDDNTTEAAARAAGVPLTLRPQWLQRLEAWHRERGRAMPENNIKQAMLPEGAEIIDNPRGTACGFYLKINKALCFFTPGVPSEFKGMFQDFIKPYIAKHLSGGAVQVRRFFCFGVSESKIAQHLKEQPFPHRIVVGYRSAYPLLEIKLIEHNAAAADDEFSCSLMRRCLKPYLICEGQLDLGERLDKLTAHAPMVLFDNISAGLAAVDLAPYLNLKSAFISTEDLSAELQQALIGSCPCRYFYQLRRGSDGESFEYRLCDLQEHKTWHYRYKLNITLKDRRRATAALVGQALLYQILSGQELLQPDNAEFTVIEEPKA